MRSTSPPPPRKYYMLGCAALRPYPQVFLKMHFIFSSTCKLRFRSLKTTLFENSCQGEGFQKLCWRVKTRQHEFLACDVKVRAVIFFVLGRHIVQWWIICSINSACCNIFVLLTVYSSVILRYNPTSLSVCTFDSPVLDAPLLTVSHVASTICEFLAQYPWEKVQSCNQQWPPHYSGSQKLGCGYKPAIGWLFHWEFSSPSSIYWHLFCKGTVAASWA